MRKDIPPLTRRATIIIAAILLLSSATPASAQPQRPAPHIGYVYPAGGQQGTTFTVSIGGQNLESAAAAYFSGEGASAKIAGFDRPMSQKELNDLREKLQQLQDKRTAARAAPAPGTSSEARPSFTDEDEKLLAEWRTRLANRPNRQANPALAETVTLEVTLAPNAAPGEREVRLRTAAGLSNPFLFCIGPLPEFTRPVVTASMNPPSRPKAPAGAPKRSQPADLAITLPATVNGQILPGAVDRFHFSAMKGQKLVIAAQARALIPYLADAVPGWFQAALGLYDAEGREVAYADDYRFNPDPVLFVDVPATGDYTVEINDAIFRGREDFVYRVSVGELPFIKSIFPLGGKIGGELAFELGGWNLTATKLLMPTRDMRPGTFQVSVSNPQGPSNAVRVMLDGAPDIRESEPNDRLDDAQPIELPVALNGRIDRPDDRDTYRFEAKAGSTVVAEIFGRRLGSPIDSVLTLTDADGERVGFNDDADDKGAGLLTHQADSRLVATLPEDGDYFLTVTESEHRGGPDYGYRLRVSAPQPDFELRVVPSTINLRAGGSAAITVYALRRDGFDGMIGLVLKDAPRGFTLGGGRIPAKADKVQLTLTAPAQAADEPFDLTLVGFATIADKVVAHAAVPAEDMMQAFAYRHLVPAKELKVDVIGRGPSYRVLTKLPLQIPAGGNVRLRLGVLAGRLAGQVQLEFGEPIEGLSLTQSAGGTDVIDVVIACDASKIKPGLQGNLLLRGSAERTNTTGAARGQKIPLGVTPAIPFQVVPAISPATST